LTQGQNFIFLLASFLATRLKICWQTVFPIYESCEWSY